MSNTEVNLQGLIIDGRITSHIDETPYVNETRGCAQCGGPTTRKYCSTACYRIVQRSGDPVARFWSKVHKTHSCWLWTAGTISYGYGSFSVAKGKPRGQQAPVYAHRYSWELAHGPIPAGRSILHNCPGGDNPRCVNPAHLFLGNQDANMKDAAAKGTLHVPRPSRQVVTPEQLQEIDALLANGTPQVRIAERYGVSKTWVCLYAKGERRQYDRPAHAGTRGAYRRKVA